MSPFKQKIASLSIAALIAVVTYQLYFAPPDKSFAGPQFGLLFIEVNSADKLTLGAVVSGLGVAASSERNMLQSPYGQFISSVARQDQHYRDDVRCRIIIGVALTRKRECNFVNQLMAQVDG